RYLRVVLIIASIGFIAWLASQAYSLYPPLGWLILLVFMAVIVYGAIRDVVPQLPFTELDGRSIIYRTKTREKVLEELINKLPITSDAVAYRIKEILISRISAKEGISVAEATSRARELVKDKLLLKILDGDVRPLSQNEVKELLEKITEI
ncbi:MAG: hypothetical protein QW760_07430, partial [Thermofilaceae archaeon]